MGLVTVACDGCVTSTIVAVPINFLYFKITRIVMLICATTLKVMKMASIWWQVVLLRKLVIKLLNLWVTINLNLNRYKCNKWNAFKVRYFWDSTTGFSKSLNKVLFKFCLWRVLWPYLSPHMWHRIVMWLHHPPFLCCHI